MKFLPLIWAGVWRKPVRSTLILLSVINAFLLFGLLQGFVGGLARAATLAQGDVLLTSSSVSQFEPLPLAVGSAITRLDGVRAVSPMVSFQGYYQKPIQPVRAYALDSSQFVDTIPALHLTADQLEQMRSKPTAAEVSEDLAAKYGWRVGDRIPLLSRIWINQDGSKLWPVEIVGIYVSETNLLLKNALLLNYDYLDKGRINDRGTATTFIVRLKSASDASRTETAIDSLFRNSPSETKTTTESQRALDVAKNIGDVDAIARGIMGSVFFALLLSIGAILFHSVRERTSELAILKALGFSNPGILTLLVAESLLLFVVAAVVGLNLATMAFKPAVKLMGFTAIQSGPVLLEGLALAAGLALIASLPPAVRAVRKSVVEGLAET